MTQETWLLTGGAGYIGTHIADEFIRNGKNVVIYDSLYQGLESRHDSSWGTVEVIESSTDLESKS